MEIGASTVGCTRSHASDTRRDRRSCAVAICRARRARRGTHGRWRALLSQPARARDVDSAPATPTSPTGTRAQARRSRDAHGSVALRTRARDRARSRATSGCSWAEARRYRSAPVAGRQSERMLEAARRCSSSCRRVVGIVPSSTKLARTAASVSSSGVCRSSRGSSTGRSGRSPSSLQTSRGAALTLSAEGTALGRHTDIRRDARARRGCQRARRSSGR